ncbi:MAG: hypothetical protein OHK0017_09010 [Patescibacteria group bacterium]
MLNQNSAIAVLNECLNQNRMLSYSEFKVIYFSSITNSQVLETGMSGYEMNEIQDYIAQNIYSKIKMEFEQQQKIDQIYNQFRSFVKKYLFRTSKLNLAEQKLNQLSLIDFINFSRRDNLQSSNETLSGIVKITLLN